MREWGLELLEESGEEADSFRENGWEKRDHGRAEGLLLRQLVRSRRDWDGLGR